MSQDLVMQELKAKLFEATEELKIYKLNEKQMDYISRENRQLQNDKVILCETLQRAADKISFMEDEKELLQSHCYGSQLASEASANDIKKLQETIDDLRKEIIKHKTTIEELVANKKAQDQLLLEMKQSTSLAEESSLAKRRAAEEQITALTKINAKLVEALNMRNGDTNGLSKNP